jgi:mRNA interferase RelE/StbE
VNYQVTLSQEARKNLDRIDRTTCTRIQQRLHELAEHPHDPRISKILHGMEGMRSSRVGNWRIVYIIQNEAEAIFIVAIRPRGGAYRKL